MPTRSSASPSSVIPASVNAEETNLRSALSSAELHRPRALEPSVAEAHQLDAPAAHVHREPARHGEIVHRTEEAEPCLVVAVDHLERHPQVLRAPNELVPVRGVPHRGRRHRDHVRGPGSPRDRLEIAEGLQGAFDGFRTEGVRIAEIPRQP